MDWMLPSNKAAPNKGRRAGQRLLSPRSEDRSSLSNDDPMESSPPGSAQSFEDHHPIAPPRARRTGGWADEGTKSGKRRSATNFIERERFGSPEGRKQYDSDDDIPTIPELEDMQSEESSRVHQAPSVAMNRAAAYRELESDLLKKSSFTKLDDINLTLLASSLYSEAEMRDEKDVAYTWDLLFAEVSSELQREAESIKVNSERPSSNDD